MMTTQPLTLQQQAQLNDLRELEASGITLPMPAEQIIMIEAQGDFVDLDTGEIIKGGALDRFDITEQGRQVLSEAIRGQ